jgi:hypothetical protein
MNVQQQEHDSSITLIYSHLEGLEELAAQSGYSFLTFLIGMARQEAEETQKGSSVPVKH